MTPFDPGVNQHEAARMHFSKKFTTSAAIAILLFSGQLAADTPTGPWAAAAASAIDDAIGQRMEEAGIEGPPGSS